MSSSDEDCMVVPSEPEEEEEDDPDNSGLHVNDALNVPDEMGQVLVNVGHPPEEQDIFLADQLARSVKPHQVCSMRMVCSYNNYIYASLPEIHGFPFFISPD